MAFIKTAYSAVLLAALAAPTAAQALCWYDNPVATELCELKEATKEASREQQQRFDEEKREREERYYEQAKIEMQAEQYRRITEEKQRAHEAQQRAERITSEEKQQSVLGAKAGQSAMDLMLALPPDPNYKPSPFMLNPDPSGPKTPEDFGTYSQADNEALAKLGKEGR